MHNTKQMHLYIDKNHYVECRTVCCQLQLAVRGMEITAIISVVARDEDLTGDFFVSPVSFLLNAGA